jgi:tyrosine-specific transport protein
MIKNKLFGAILIVAGTAIGASMLALPLASSSVGILNSTVLLVLLWLLGYYTAVMALKINLFHNGAFSISELCRKTFSPKVAGRIAIIADLSIVVLFYSLLAAYISGIVEISLVRDLFPEGVGGYIGLSMVVVLIVFIVSSFKVLDFGNRAIFIFKMVIFFTLLILLMPEIKSENIFNLSANVFGGDDVYKVVPIFFTSFGFHGSIPFIIKYLDQDEVQVKKAFLYGSLLSLGVYLLWIFFTVAVLPQQGDVSFLSVKNGENNLGDFIMALTNLTGQGSLSLIATMFSWLAIITSFLGVGVGLYDYFLEKLKLDNKLLINKIKAGVITFAPPIVLVIVNKDIFAKALAFAAISLSILAVVLPSLVALKINKNKTMFFKPFVLTAFLIGLLIIIFELLNFLH